MSLFGSWLAGQRKTCYTLALGHTLNHIWNKVRDVILETEKSPIEGDFKHKMLTHYNTLCDIYFMMLYGYVFIHTASQGMVIIIYCAN